MSGKYLAAERPIFLLVIIEDMHVGSKQEQPSCSELDRRGEQEDCCNLRLPRKIRKRRGIRAQALEGASIVQPRVHVRKRHGVTHSVKRRRRALSRFAPASFWYLR